MDKTTRIQDNCCSECGTQLSAMTSFEDRVPEPGDIAICIRCGNIAEYIEGGALVTASEKTITGLKEDKEFWAQIVKYQEAVTTMHGNEA